MIYRKKGMAMGRCFLTYSGIIQLLILLHGATVIVSLDQADFSDRFRQVVENILGVQPYEVLAHLSSISHSIRRLH